MPLNPTPLCPFFGRCGGCATQHLSYNIQLENKCSRLEKAIHFSGIQVFSGNEWGYRNRMDMTFTPEGLGFREGGKWWKSLPTPTCVISTPRLNELIAEVNAFFGPDFDAFHLKTTEGTFKYAVLRTPQNDSSVSIVLNADSPRYDEAAKKVEAYSRASSANHVILTRVKAKSSQSVGDDYDVLKGHDTLEEGFLGQRFRYSVQGFFQNNSAMAEQMHAYVNKLFVQTERGPYAHLLDLYGGVGTFGIINASLFKSVTTVESFEGCTRAAQENIALNAVTNVQAICLDADKLKSIKLTSGDSLFVLTDPPRSGMSQETIIQLKKLSPKMIVYISCNVDQLSKDLPKFKDYHLKSAALFDFFPQTNHMESVVELVR